MTSVAARRVPTAETGRYIGAIRTFLTGVCPLGVDVSLTTDSRSPPPDSVVPGGIRVFKHISDVVGRVGRNRLATYRPAPNLRAGPRQRLDGFATIPFSQLTDLDLCTTDRTRSTVPPGQGRTDRWEAISLRGGDPQGDRRESGPPTGGPDHGARPCPTGRPHGSGGPGTPDGSIGALQYPGYDTDGDATVAL